MIAIVTGWDAALAHWVGRRLGVELGPGCSALGFAEGGELLAAIAYHNLQWPNVESSIAATSSRWCNRRTLFACFWHPFCQLRCRRLGANTAVTNHHTREFLERLGFRLEGVAREAMREGDGVVDAAIYGMLARECRWLPGQSLPAPAPQGVGATGIAAADLR